jgi:hypothetical protein
MVSAGSKQNRKPEGYRGALLYTQEDGYKMVSMQVHLYEGEHSRVMSHSYEILREEEAEHLTAQPPLGGVDLYYFPATDSATNILLTVESQEERHSAVYSVGEHGIDELSPYLWLDVMEEKTLDQEPQTPHDSEMAFDEAIEYYKDQIPSWLASQEPQLNTTISEPFHYQSRDFER